MATVIRSDLYMEGVRVELGPPTLRENLLAHGPEQIVTFEVSRYYYDQLEEGILVALTPKEAMAWSLEFDRVLMRGWGKDVDDYDS